MKQRTVARCQSCGATMPRWVGRCGECGEWGTVVEEPVAPRSTPATKAAAAVATTPLAEHEISEQLRVSTALPEVDRVLGGGLVLGSVLLLAGEPGVGKSTLTLQLAMAVGHGIKVLLVCGEESPQQVRARAERLGEIPERIHTLDDASLPAIAAAIEQLPEGSLAIIDSIQTAHDPEIASAPGSVSQVRECGAALARLARARGVTVILVGHVTKEGTVAGPRVLEHLVDVVLSFDGDRQGHVRILRALKNRFGTVQEAGFFDMSSEGLTPIRDASKYLLADRSSGLSGSVLAAAVDGRRPFMCEVQALVAPTRAPMPRRVAVGVDGSRLPILAAVVSRRLKIQLHEHDIFVSAVGGIQIAEPAADLAVVMAMLSSLRDGALPGDMCAFGEVGLSGEVRQVAAAERRLAEARAAGCRRAVVPYNMTASTPGLELIRARSVGDLLTLFPRPAG